MAGVEVPVVPGGSSRSVTYDNRLEYVEAAVAYRLAECDVQVDAIRAGLACMVPVKLLCLFTSYVCWAASGTCFTRACMTPMSGGGFAFSDAIMSRIESFP